MAAPLATSHSSEPVGSIARSLHWSTRLTYQLASRSRGHVLLEHEAEFGHLRDCPLGREDTLKTLLIAVYGEQNIWPFQVAREALSLFNTAFMALESLCGLEFVGDQLAGYFLDGPTNRLLRTLRLATARDVESRDDCDELAATVVQVATQLKTALQIEPVSDRMAIRAEAERLVHGPHESLEQVAEELSISLPRRDARAVAFVALSLAGWEPDMEGWDKNIASVIRDQTALRGQYHVSMPLTRAIQRDIMVAVSLRRRNVSMTLDGTILRRVYTAHVNQDAVAEYVREQSRPDEKMVSTLWGPFERTADVDWDTVKEFIAQTGPIRYEWTSCINQIKEIGRACVLMNGVETGEVFLNMSRYIRTNSPNIYRIWEKTISQSSLTALTCVASTTAAARAAIIERMVISTVTDGSCYHISSIPIFLRVEDHTARLYDNEGNLVFVDGILENMADREAADVSVKFFALLTRAMDGGIVKPGFYQDSTRQASVLRAKGPREGFDQKDETETETTAKRTWRQLCDSPLALGNGEQPTDVQS